MYRPLLYILIFLIIGILANVFTNFIVNVLIFFVMLFISLYLAKKYKIKFPNFLIFFYIIGYCLVGLNNLPYNIKEKEEIQGIGYVKNIEKTKSEKYKFILKTVSINNKKSFENILVYTNNLYNIEEGAKIYVKGTIYYPKTKSNYAGYNEEMAFKIDKIKYKLYAKDIQIIKYSKIISWLNKFKNNIFFIYDNILPYKESNILKAMILGDKSFLDDETIDLYKTSGIYHILAISGLHIGILSIFFTKVFKFFFKRTGYVLAIISLILYCIFTGGSLSTIRATIMAIITLIAFLIYRRPDFISSISLSAIILLFINPYYLFDIGFLYSYVSVFSIAFLGGRFSTLYNLTGIKKAFVVSFFVSIAIKPITAYYFYNFSILDAFINVLILPFMSITVVIGFLVIIIGIFSIPLAKIFVGCVYYILRFFTYTCKVVDNMKFNNIIIGKPSLILILGLYTMLILIGYAIYNKHCVRKRKKFINIGMVIFISSIFCTIFVPKPFNVTMLDVGQGDSLVGINKDGVFLVDGGGNNNFSVGENIVLNYLKSKGIDTIDFVFISHNDSDHIKGVIEIFNKIHINNLFLPINNEKDDNFYKLITLAKDKHIPVYFLKNGDILKLGKNIEFKVMHPNERFYNKDDNNNSLVLNMKYKNNFMLFTGDIEKQAEDFLIKNNEDIKTDILKIPHHGSKTSTTIDFIEKTKPKVALISCKENNIYNHPDKKVISTLKDNNIKIYRTDLNGDISINFYKDKYKIKCVKNIH